MAATADKNKTDAPAAFKSEELVGEFIGTYLLILTVGCNVLGGNAAMAVLSIASVLMISIYALAGVSGANFNPAVSFALCIAGEMNPTKMGAYIVTQLIAGAAAAATYTWVHGKAFELKPNAEYGLTSALLVEVAYTFLLVLAVFRTAVSKVNKKNGDKDIRMETFGLSIGFSVVAGGYGGGAISGGCFNPAVAFGIATTHLSTMPTFAYYTVAELVGASLAYAVHNQVEVKGPHSTTNVMLSEFIGTFMLVLTVGLNVLTSSPAAALSIAASLMVMIYAMADTSGSNFNPAVTVALALNGDLDWTKDVPYYFIAQLLGGLCAGCAYSGITGGSIPLAPGAGHTWAEAAFAEIMYTFVLCFTVLNVACRNGGAGGCFSNIFGLAIGFCVVVGGFAIGSVSGGSLNPAVSFGLDASHAIKGGGAPLNWLSYTAFELMGGALAAGAYKVCNPVKANSAATPAKTN